MGKVAAWRPVRRGKNDRALTRYKSHYGVNLLDPSPPTDFQPPGTMLGCRLWATSIRIKSHCLPLALSLSILPTLYFFLYLSRSISISISHSYCLRCRHVPSSSLFVYSVSISLFLSSSLSPWFYSASYPHSRYPRGTPTPTDESQGISVPGTSACWLNLQSPLSLSERLAVLSLFLSPRFSPSLSDSYQNRFVRRHDRWRDRSIGRYTTRFSHETRETISLCGINLTTKI